MNDIIKGTMKTKIRDTLIINDNNISNIVKEALINKGYDLIVTPLIDGANYFHGESIEIFQTIKQY